VSASALLKEMIDLTRLQVERVIKRDHQGLLEGARQQEALLAALQEAEIDGSPEELRALVEDLERERAKLRSLIEAESQRVDFLMRLLLGGPEPPGVGYPPGVKKPAGGRVLNKKT